MIRSSIETIEQFKKVLIDLPEDCYARPAEGLFNATIGQHTRHVIELYQCLLDGYEMGEVCYDRRKRDLKIEQDVYFALERFHQIQRRLERPNKELGVIYGIGDNEVQLESNYYREVMYNLEHCIHHQALIKVGICQLSDLVVPDSFGVAPSTIAYRKQCVQ